MPSSILPSSGGERENRLSIERKICLRRNSGPLRAFPPPFSRALEQNGPFTEDGSVFNTAKAAEGLRRPRREHFNHPRRPIFSS